MAMGDHPAFPASVSLLLEEVKQVNEDVKCAMEDSKKGCGM